MFGRYAVPNITVFIIAGQLLVFMLAMRDPGAIDRISMDTAKVMTGEWWRVFTFTLIPPMMHPVWAFCYYYLFHLMGTALELYWGTFRYNLFLLIGYLATMTAAFIPGNGFATNGFLQGTVFLAFAHLNPNFELRIFFLFPIRIKWLALLTWIGFGFAVLNGPWSVKISVIASVLNFFLFFGNDIRYRMIGGHRHMRGQVKRFTEKPPAYFHKCAVCGITDTTHPRMDFRYCSQCTADQAYCTDHLRNHEHT